MIRSFFFFTAASTILLCACQKMDVTSVRSQADSSNPETKANNAANSPDRFFVSLSDAKRYSELYKPGESYSVTPFVNERDTLLYLFNYKEGWMVLSGDRRMTPVLAQDTQGAITLEDGSASSFWLKQYAEEVSRLRKDEEQKDNEYSAIWKALSPKKDSLYTRSDPKWVIREVLYNETSVFDAIVPVMLQTKWGQQAPWNNDYPLDTYFNTRCYVGCVAIAFAQVLYYWHNYSGTPTKLSHTISCNSTVHSGYVYNGGQSMLNLIYNIGFSRSNETTNSIRWADMALSASSGGNTGYVGDFMLDIGNRIQTGYSGCLSGAYFNNAAYLLSLYYGFNYAYGSYSESGIKAQLQNHRPVIVQATSTDNSSNHAWVIDGRTIETQYYSMFRYCEYSTDWGPDDEVYDTFEDAQAMYGFSAPYDLRPFSRTIVFDYFHMNWGEDGGDDGLYICDKNWYFFNYGCTYSQTNMNTCYLYY